MNFMFQHDTLQTLKIEPKADLLKPIVCVAQSIISCIGQLCVLILMKPAYADWLLPLMNSPLSLCYYITGRYNDGNGWLYCGSSSREM